jgi:excisionase family DNA binding protein
LVENIAHPPRGRDQGEDALTGSKRGLKTRAERRAYTVEEFAAAYRISPRTLYRLWRQGTGPRRVRVGRRILITVEDAEAWMAKEKKGS